MRYVIKGCHNLIIVGYFRNKIWLLSDCAQFGERSNNYPNNKITIYIIIPTVFKADSMLKYNKNLENDSSIEMNIICFSANLFANIHRITRQM